MASILVTNDFPPKFGGIQSYLYGLWSRLPPGETTVLTTRARRAHDWDERQPFRIERVRQRVLLPTPELARRIDHLVREVRADIVFLDPMLPLGLVGLRLKSAPYVVVTHGSEVTVAGHLPGTRALAQRALRTAAGIVAAGRYPAAQVVHAMGSEPVPGVVIPPGVDVGHFRPLDEAPRAEARVRFGLDPDRPLVVGVSRLVPRKGFDVLLDALAWLPRVQVAIGGTGRDGRRLRYLGRVLGDRAHFLGPVSHDDLPLLYGAADVFAMPCRERWSGLEAEGFGIVFLEAAACGVPVVAGRSGGSHEAVVDGETGYVVDARRSRGVYRALERLLGDAQHRTAMGQAGLGRAREEFAYDRLAQRLAPLAAGDLDVLAPLPVG